MILCAFAAAIASIAVTTADVPRATAASAAAKRSPATTVALAVGETCPYFQDGPTGLEGELGAEDCARHRQIETQHGRANLLATAGRPDHTGPFRASSSQ